MCDEFDPVFVFTERAHMILMNSVLKQQHVNFISIRRCSVSVSSVCHVSRRFYLLCQEKRKIWHQH